MLLLHNYYCNVPNNLEIKQIMEERTTTTTTTTTKQPLDLEYSEIKLFKKKQKQTLYQNGIIFDILPLSPYVAIKYTGQYTCSNFAKQP